MSDTFFGVSDVRELLANPEPIVARKTQADLKKTFEKRPSWLCIGFDVSYSCIAGAAVMYDGLLDRMRGPSTVTQRWTSGEHYFERCAVAARAENLVLDLMSGTGAVILNIDDVFIAIEEPWPMGMAKKMKSDWLKQQAQFQGVLLGSLLRHGYRNIYEVNNITWKKPIADEMGISLRSPKFKWVVKEWAIGAYGVEDLPDLINSSHGKIPKPEKSRAKPVQPDDIYDALGVMEYMRGQIEESDLVA